MSQLPKLLLYCGALFASMCIFGVLDHDRLKGKEIAVQQSIIDLYESDASPELITREYSKLSRARESTPAGRWLPSTVWLVGGIILGFGVAERGAKKLRDKSSH